MNVIDRWKRLRATRESPSLDPLASFEQDWFDTLVPTHPKDLYRIPWAVAAGLLLVGLGCTFDAYDTWQARRTLARQRRRHTWR